MTWHKMMPVTSNESKILVRICFPLRSLQGLIQMSNMQSEPEITSMIVLSIILKDPVLIDVQPEASAK